MRLGWGQHPYYYYFDPMRDAIMLCTLLEMMMQLEKIAPFFYIFMNPPVPTPLIAFHSSFKVCTKVQPVPKGFAYPLKQIHSCLKHTQQQTVLLLVWNNSGMQNNVVMVKFSCHPFSFGSGAKHKFPIRSFDGLTSNQNVELSHGNC